MHRIYKSFVWRANEKEISYVFRMVDIASELECKIAFFDTDLEDGIKLALGCDEADSLIEFENRSKNRISFDSWKTISQTEFHTAINITTGINDSSFFSALKNQLGKWFNFSSQPFSWIEMILIPYNEHAEQHIIQKIDKAFLNSVSSGRQPSYDEIKEAIESMISDGDQVTYFRSGIYWDARITINSLELLVVRLINNSDETISDLVILNGNIEIAKQFSQAIANLCGTMLLDVDYDNALVFKPVVDAYT